MAEDLLQPWDHQPRGGRGCHGLVGTSSRGKFYDFSYEIWKVPVNSVVLFPWINWWMCGNMNVASCFKYFFAAKRTAWSLEMCFDADIALSMVGEIVRWGPPSWPNDQFILSSPGVFQQETTIFMSQLLGATETSEFCFPGASPEGFTRWQDGPMSFSPVV